LVEAPCAFAVNETVAPLADAVTRLPALIVVARAEAILAGVEVWPVDVEYVVPFTTTETVPVSYEGPNWAGAPPVMVPDAGDIVNDVTVIELVIPVVKLRFEPSVLWNVIVDPEDVAVIPEIALTPLVRF